MYLFGWHADLKPDNLTRNSFLAKFRAKILADCHENIIQTSFLSGPHLVSELLYQYNQFWRTKKLNVCYSLFQIICHFIQSWVMICFCKCAIRINQVLNPLLLESVLLFSTIC